MIWKNTIPGIVDSTATRFSETSTYKKSDYVWYVGTGENPKLYKAKEDINAGAWNASKWEESVETNEFVNKGNLLAAKKDLHTNIEGNLIYETSYGEYIEKVVQPSYVDVDDFDTTYHEGDVLWFEPHPDWDGYYIKHDTMVIVGPSGEGAIADDIAFRVISEHEDDWGFIGAAKWNSDESKYEWRPEFTQTPVEGNWYGADDGFFIKYTGGAIEAPKWAPSTGLQDLEDNGVETGDYVCCGQGVFGLDLYHVLTMSPEVFKNEIGALDLAVTQYEFAPKLSDISMDDAYYGMLFYKDHQLYAMLTRNNYPNNDMNGDPGLFEIVNLGSCYAAKIERFEQLSYFIHHDAYPATDALFANIFGEGGLPVRYGGDYLTIKGNNFHGWFEPDFGCARFTIKDDPDNIRPKGLEIDLSEVSTELPMHNNSLDGLQLWLEDERSDTSDPVFDFFTVKNGQIHLSFSTESEDHPYFANTFVATNAVIQNEADPFRLGETVKLMGSTLIYIRSYTDIYGETGDSITAYNSTITTGLFGFAGDGTIADVNYAGRVVLYNSIIDFSNSRVEEMHHTLNIEAHNSMVKYSDEYSGVKIYCETLFNINFEHSSLFYRNRGTNNQTTYPKLKLFEGPSIYSNFYYTENQNLLPEEQHKMTFEHWTDKDLNIANAVYVDGNPDSNKYLIYHTFPVGGGGTDFHAEFIRAMNALTTQLGLTYTATQDTSGDYQYTFNLNN